MGRMFSRMFRNLFQLANSFELWRLSFLPRQTTLKLWHILQSHVIQFCNFCTVYWNLGLVFYREVNLQMLFVLQYLYRTYPWQKRLDHSINICVWTDVAASFSLLFQNVIYIEVVLYGNMVYLDNSNHFQTYVSRVVPSGYQWIYYKLQYNYF